MINFSQATHLLIPELANYRNKIIDASIVGHSALARTLRLEAAGIMIQASFEEESPLLEQATLLKKNHLAAMQQGEQEKAKEWLLAAYSAYQSSLYGPSIKDASQKAMQQRIFLASQLIKSPQEHDCQEQAAFHAENAVDYLLRKKEAEQAQHDFLANCWKEVAQGASDTSLLWMKAAESFCSYSLFALIPLLRIERVRHAENKNKRKLLHIACYFSTLLSQQQWKDPLADKNLCRKKILQATSAGNLALASFWRLTEKEIDFFLQQSNHFSTPNDSEDWRAFALTRIFHTYHSEAMEKADGTRNSILTQYPSALAKPQTERHEISGLSTTTPLQGFLYGIANPSCSIPATSWIFATDERMEVAAHYRYWVVRSQFLSKDQSPDWSSRLKIEAFSSSAEDKIDFWKECAHDYQTYATDSQATAWEEAASGAQKLVLLWKKVAEKKFPLLKKIHFFTARSVEKKLQQHLRTLLMQTISFCLPEECIPDLACEQSWREGKLVPRIEFTMFYSWIYQSWQRLQQAGINSLLSNKLLEPGVTVTLGNYLTTSLGLDSRMPQETFLVDVAADRPPHPGAQLHVAENKLQGRLLPHAVYIPHWPQRSLIPRDSKRGARFENVVFFGESENLAPELRSKEWQQRLAKELEISFYLQGNLGWHDYRNVDAVIAIRSFSSSRYLNKPATKLYNAWHAGVPFIGGRDSAYAADGRPGIDYLVATSPEEVFSHLEQLKKNPELRRNLVEEGSLSAKNFTHEVILEHWKKLIQETIPKNVEAWQKKSKWGRHFFFMRQYFACLFFRHWK